MKIPQHIPVYGDMSYRGNCPKEMVEQSSLVNKMRKEFPDTYGLIIVHPRNEGMILAGQHSAMIRHRAEGMCKGASDILIGGSPSLALEIKRQNPLQSQIDPDQIRFLEATQRAGGYACVALGAIAGWKAVLDWIEMQR